MSIYNPFIDLSALRNQLAYNRGLVIACYCAAWCDTCTKYHGDFNTLAAQWPQHTFVWIDIEECPELLGDEDVENFPTVSIQGLAGNLFFGTLLPHISHLDRLISHIDEAAPAVAGPPLLRALLTATAQ